MFGTGNMEQKIKQQTELQTQIQNEIIAIRKLRKKLIISIGIGIVCTVVAVWLLAAGITTGILMPPAIASVGITVIQLVTNFIDLRNKTASLAEATKLKRKISLLHPDEQNNNDIRDFVIRRHKQETTSSCVSLLLSAAGMLLSASSGIINLVAKLPQVVSVVASFGALAVSVIFGFVPACKRFWLAVKNFTKEKINHALPPKQSNADMVQAKAYIHTSKAILKRVNSHTECQDRVCQSDDNHNVLAKLNQKNDTRA